MMQTKTHKFEVKQLSEDGVFEGYASVFDVIDYQGEKILPGAFKCAALENVKMLWQHDVHNPIGVWEVIREDSYGLYVKGRLLMDLVKGREAYTLLKAGVIEGLSVGFKPVKSHFDKKVRVISDVDLHEISLVTFAANPKARVLSVKEQMDLKSQFLNLQKIIRQLTNNMNVYA